MAGRYTDSGGQFLALPWRGISAATSMRHRDAVCGNLWCSESRPAHDCRLMTASRSPLAGAILFIAVCGHASSLRAQGIEITPFGGYRFGGDFFELVTGQPVDADGAPAVGAIVDIPLGNGLQVEALFTHQNAHVTVPAGPLLPPIRASVSVDHWQGGGLQEYADGRVRPYATGMLGLTRYAGEGDSEMRFTVAGGGGVKVFPASKVGVRLNGQLSATFVYADARVTGCSPGICFFNFTADIVWQLEFSVGLILKVH